jgi:hypothetical protein
MYVTSTTYLDTMVVDMLTRVPITTILFHSCSLVDYDEVASASNINGFTLNSLCTVFDFNISSCVLLPSNNMMSNRMSNTLGTIINVKISKTR